MPVPRYGSSPVGRPSGLIPPPVDLGGVTELRLHGVGGTTAEDLLGDLAPQQVSGDRIAGFYRTADLPARPATPPDPERDQPSRHIEAYSWGGLTSRSGSRVLWLLLLPFALANLAGWMCSPRTHRNGFLFRLHRTAVRWTALGITVNVVLITALASMELIGYQCGARDDCAGQIWLLSWLRDPVLAAHPAQRVAIGAILPLLVIVGLAILTLRTISRYEEIKPPFLAGQEPAREAVSAAQPRRGLADRGFWDGRRSAFDQGCAHVAAAAGWIALVLVHTAHTIGHEAGVDFAQEQWWTAALILGGGAVLGALLVTAVDGVHRVLTGTLLVVAAAALVAAAVFAVLQPSVDTATQWSYLPGMRNSINAGFIGLFGSLGLVLVSSLLGGWRKGTFFIYGPFVVLAVSIALLNAVLLGAMLRVIDVFAEVSSRLLLPGLAVDHDTLYVYPIVATLHQYLTLPPLALIAVFVVYELVSYWRAGLDSPRRKETLAFYLDEKRYPRPTAEQGWYDSAVEGAGATRWTAGVVRARKIAGMARHIDRLLTSMAAVGLILLVAIQIRYWYFHELPWGTQWTVTVGTYLAAALPVLVVLLLRRGWTNLASRRRIGVLWDISTFWPRAYHPLAPPSYAERAVPELQRRLWRLHTSGGRVVVAAHSQGTVIAAAALLQPDNLPAGGLFSLATFGSPLRTLYGWAFPAYFGDGVLRGLQSRVRVWRNYAYETDFIGGLALDPLIPANVDVVLPDPGTCWYIYGQPRPLARRHTGYWDDPAMWQGVDDMAKALAELPAPEVPDVPVQGGPPDDETEVTVTELKS
ncbi:hypothetical protein [Catellatospora tritici]|uniref:hypothetical protein n=1 Tax=Catellatospora tritici TaxID=2851566 RepID=UPI001C2D5014|nr:hypothetical protein [Catellatospora tritici]MBV1854698.1 hypothetical protein [Catellatospora tritici]